ncbi:hypothetical protein R3P38DRAFT_1416178 [Favolaschia claudopus]|uniref:Phosphatidic acid phosphatase type 2/haloperoxidase domain-containing protein n=1 Tax=Favolaschia claudopus TaxID=2862362 RepID=A0AAW0AQ45_9AGAR
MSSNRGSWLWIVLDKSNLVVIGVTAVAILATRSAAVFFCGAVGAVSCSLSVKVVKLLIRQPRPVLGRKKTYGCVEPSNMSSAAYAPLHSRMPSTHSASIGYFATYVLLASFYLPLHPSIPGGETARIVVPIVVLPLASIVAMSRVWLGHHTWAQIAVGCAYGVGWAFLCFRVWTKALSEHGQKVEHFLDRLLGWR